MIALDPLWLKKDLFRVSQLSVQANEIIKLKMFLQKGNIPQICVHCSPQAVTWSRQDVMGASVYQVGEEMLQVDLYKVHLAATSPL